MRQLKYNKNLYSKTALIKAAYNFTDKAYVHLDVDENYYYVFLSVKNDGEDVSNDEFENEVLAQSVRHEIYLQTKNIRELMLARAVATSVIGAKNEDESSCGEIDKNFSENKILEDWFNTND